MTLLGRQLFGLKKYEFKTPGFCEFKTQARLRAFSLKKSLHPVQRLVHTVDAICRLQNPFSLRDVGALSG